MLPFVSLNLKNPSSIIPAGAGALQEPKGNTTLAGGVRVS